MNNRKIDPLRLGIVITGGLVAVVVLCILGRVIFGALFSTGLNVLEEVQVELGDKVILNMDMFANGMSEKDMENTNISSNLLKDDKKYTYYEDTKEVVTANKGYLDSGTYTIHFKLNGKEASTKLIVKDTKQPKITEIGDSHSVSVGVAQFDYTSLVDISDYSDFDVNINSAEVDLNRAGTYPIYYRAVDVEGNEATATVYLTVGSPTAYEYTTGSEDIEDGDNLENTGSDTVTNGTGSNWREKYNTSPGKDSGGSLDKNNLPTTKTFSSEEEAKAFTDELASNGIVSSWTISRSDDGGVTYNFTYGN